MKSLFYSIDLFAGCGGLMDGFEKNPMFSTLACVEWETEPCNTLRKRLSEKYHRTNAEDIVVRFDIQRTEELFSGFNDDNFGRNQGLDKIIGNNKIDIIIGGPPCQAYSIAGRIRDEHGMKNVMLAYDYKCAITRQVISCNGFINLEAAHIKPQAHNGVFLPCNGIAMSRDLHFAFDKGFFTLTPDLRVKIHDEVLKTDSYINQFNNAQIFVPQVDYFRPREEFLMHHREHVFGSFRQIRSN